MRMPRTIKVGHRLFEIISWDSKAATAEGAQGDCRESTATIRIANDLTRPDKAACMIHELFHACWRYLPDRPDEETAVSVLSENFSQIWSDNPSLVAWISESFSKR